MSGLWGGVGGEEAVTQWSRGEPTGSYSTRPVAGRSDRVVLQGMQFFGQHGVYAFEKEKGQVFLVDLELSLSLEDAGKRDQIQDTVDYGRAYRAVQEVVEGAPYRLIESVAERVAEVVLSRFPKVEAVSVRIHKPRAPLPGAFTDVFVEIHRRRA